MKDKVFFLSRLSNHALITFIITIVLIKVLYFLLVGFGWLSFSFGEGSDAVYYHDYAIGNVDHATTIWPVILRQLNDFGIYSRDFVSLILFIISVFFLPYLTTKLSGLSVVDEQNNFFSLFLIVTVYPTLLFYSTDIFRDVFMVFIFLLALLLSKLLLLTKSNLIKFGLILLLFPVIYFLFELRNYLGISILLALLFVGVKLNKKKIILYSLLYIFILFSLNYLGFFSSITEYRELFEQAGGGSTIGLNFSNPVLFVPNFILSFLAQMFGLYITNPIAIIIFFIETIPFFAAFLYIIRNIKYQDAFVRYLLLFFIIYASVWVIGNDNVGTAVRLRMFNYFAIYICAFYIMHKKYLHSLRG